MKMISAFEQYSDNNQHVNQRAFNTAFIGFAETLSVVKIVYSAKYMFFVL